MARVYALTNQKGGVGKTTTAINLGAYLAASGRKVLVVDADPQANATSSLGIDKRALTRSIYDVLIGGMFMEQVVTLTKRLGLDLVPSSPALAGAGVELVNMTARERRLQRALKPLRERYDYILIDSPPSLGLLTINALTAADGVIIPVQCEYLALEGLAQLLKTIELVRRNLNSRLAVRGVLLTMYDVRTNLSQQVANEVRTHFDNAVFKTIIPRSVRLSEAPSYGETVLSYAPGSRGALAYQALTAELLKSDEKTAVKARKEPA